MPNKYETSIIFKAQLDKGLWRKIRIGSDATLDDLSYMILSAYNFDNDHLYAFFMDNKIWSRGERYWSPHNEEPPFAHEKKLSDLNLSKGNKFKYLFDFGDEWVFQMTVVDVIEEATPNPEIFGIKGEAPPQYGWAEDEEEYDEDE